MRKSALIVASFTAMALALGGCQSSLTGDTYSREEARTVQTVRMAVREDDGSTRAYVQQVDQGQIFRVGERVRILTATAPAASLTDSSLVVPRPALRRPFSLCRRATAGVVLLSFKSLPLQSFFRLSGSRNA